MNHNASNDIERQLNSKDDDDNDDDDVEDD